MIFDDFHNLYLGIPTVFTFRMVEYMTDKTPKSTVTHAQVLTEKFHILEKSYEQIKIIGYFIMLLNFGPCVETYLIFTVTMVLEGFETS